MLSPTLATNFIDVNGPVDIDAAVRYGVETAHAQGLDVGHEAVSFATDRLRSKLEREAVYNSLNCAHSSFLVYRFLKGMAGGGDVVYGRRIRRKNLAPDAPVCHTGV